MGKKILDWCRLYCSLNQVLMLTSLQLSSKDCKNYAALFWLYFPWNQWFILNLEVNSGKLMLKDFENLNPKFKLHKLVILYTDNYISWSSMSHELLFSFTVQAFLWILFHNSMLIIECLNYHGIWPDSRLCSPEVNFGHPWIILIY